MTDKEKLWEKLMVHRDNPELMEILLDFTHLWQFKAQGRMSPENLARFEKLCEYINQKHKEICG